MSGAPDETRHIDLSTMRGASRLMPTVADDLAELRRLVAKGISPSALELLPKHERLVARLIAAHGTLAAAREAASIADRRKKTTRPRSVAKALRGLADRGVELSAQRLREFGEERLLDAARRAFGSLDAARLASDALLVKAPRWPRLSREETIAAIRARADRAGTVSPSDLDRDTLRSARQEFGGVVPAILAAGLVRRRKHRPKTMSPRATRPRKERAPKVPRQPRQGPRSMDHLALDPDVVRNVLAELVRRHQFSVRESHVLAAAIYGVPRSRLPEVLSVSENSAKTYVRNVLRRLEVRGMDDAVWLVRTEVGRRTKPRRGRGTSGSSVKQAVRKKAGRKQRER